MTNLGGEWWVAVSGMCRLVVDGWWWVLVIGWWCWVVGWLGYWLWMYTGGILELMVDIMMHHGE